MKVLKMNQNISILFILISLCSLCFSTTFVELSLKELSIGSSDIINAKVISINSFMTENTNRIYTEIEFLVADKLKGSLNNNNKIKMIIYGGTVNGITMFVLGGPKFSVGDDCLLFLKKLNNPLNDKDDYILYGFTQGKFDVVSKNNSKYVFRDKFIFTLKEKNGGNELRISDTEGVELDVFNSLVLNNISNK